jgi:hypothetical protein
MNASRTLAIVRRAGLRTAALLGAALAAAAAACIDPDASFVYTARPYDRAGMCLEPYVELELIPGAGGGDACTSPEAGPAGPGVACLVSSSGALYVSTVCPPYPPDYDASGKDPACPAAIAALMNGVSCAASDAASDQGTGAPDAPNDGAAPPAPGGDGGGAHD